MWTVEVRANQAAVAPQDLSKVFPQDFFFDESPQFPTDAPSVPTSAKVTEDLSSAHFFGLQIKLPAAHVILVTSSSKSPCIDVQKNR